MRGVEEGSGVVMVRAGNFFLWSRGPTGVSQASGTTTNQPSLNTMCLIPSSESLRDSYGVINSFR